MPREMMRRLKMEWAFNDCATPLNDCISQSNEVIAYVKDGNDGVSTFAEKAGEHSGCLKIINHTRHDYCLLSIDNKLLSNIVGGISDCALFDNYRFYFVEFKSNALGQTKEACDSTYETAFSQLVNTIREFSFRIGRHNIDFIKESKPVSHIVTAQKFPRNTAKEMSLAVRFATTTKTRLSFETEITF